MLITRINTDAYSNNGANIFNNQDPTVAGHREIRIFVTMSL
jgi:hypothetical protein